MKKQPRLVAVPVAMVVDAETAAVDQEAAAVVAAQTRPRSSRTIGRNTLLSYDKEWSVVTNNKVTTL
ncbi:MAG: hypothetical protein QM703_06550 [Gemmatales bacterium]